jgi:hypothetical protein
MDTDAPVCSNALLPLIIWIDSYMSLRLKSVVLLDGLVLGYNELLYISVALVNVDGLEDEDKEL